MFFVRQDLFTEARNDTLKSRETFPLDKTRAVDDTDGSYQHRPAHSGEFSLVIWAGHAGQWGCGLLATWSQLAPAPPHGGH